MIPQEIIRKKREKQELSESEIEDFIDGIAKGTVSEAQIAAMAMAVCLNGMILDERVRLTMAMTRSGLTLDWSEESLDGPVLDKHSTGGVGDKVSLILAPLVAACGAYVPMISGRGLGHTGGTLDKMDSIPGYVSLPDIDVFKAVVKNVGCAIVGATHEFAPADKTFYAVRDVTATVESVDLITASILSKKLAAGLEGLVMDVKFGSGAFMQGYDDAKELAQSIVSVSNGAGLPCTALMTDMNQVLGRTAGNAIEVRECIEFMRGDYQDVRLLEVTIALAAEMLVTGKITDTLAEGKKIAEKHLADGRAAHFFEQMVMDLGGPSDIIDKFETHLELAPNRHEVHCDDTGIVQSIDTRQIGLSVIALGGGRLQTADTIDHSVGLSNIAAPGDTVGPSEAPLAVIYGHDNDKVEKAEKMIRNAFTVSREGKEPMKRPVIRERIAG